MHQPQVPPSLRSRYEEPHRRYHGWAHIVACLDAVDQETDLAPDERNFLRSALLYHDAIYDPTTTNNEVRSALLAAETMMKAGWSRAEGAEVARLILLTRTHRTLPGDTLGRLVISIDLMGLGADWKTYCTARDDIRAEYTHLSDEAWRNGRMEFLRAYLDHRPLFPDPRYAARFEFRARANMHRELDELLAS